MVSLPHTLCHHPYQSSFFQKIAFCPKKNEQNKIHLILYIWKKKKKLKTTITFEPNITENKQKKLISWNKKTTLQTEMENACLYKLQNFLCFSPIYIVSPYNSLFWHSGSYVDNTKHLENILQKCIAIFHLWLFYLFQNR